MFVERYQRPVWVALVYEAAVHVVVLASAVVLLPAGVAVGVAALILAVEIRGDLGAARLAVVTEQVCREIHFTEAVMLQLCAVGAANHDEAISNAKRFLDETHRKDDEANGVGLLAYAVGFPVVWGVKFGAAFALAWCVAAFAPATVEKASIAIWQPFF